LGAEENPRKKDCRKKDCRKKKLKKKGNYSATDKKVCFFSKML